MVVGVVGVIRGADNLPRESRCAPEIKLLTGDTSGGGMGTAQHPILLARGVCARTPILIRKIQGGERDCASTSL
jgi:hypothetical protein